MKRRAFLLIMAFLTGCTASTMSGMVGIRLAVMTELTRRLFFILNQKTTQFYGKFLFALTMFLASIPIHAGCLDDATQEIEDARTDHPSNLRFEPLQPWFFKNVIEAYLHKCREQNTCSEKSMKDVFNVVKESLSKNEKLPPNHVLYEKDVLDSYYSCVRAELKNHLEKTATAQHPSRNGEEKQKPNPRAMK